MQMGKKIDEESVGNWSANRKGHPKAQIAGKGRREGITQLLAPGKDGWRQYFNLVWVTGNGFSTGSEEPPNSEEEISFLLEPEV